MKGSLISRVWAFLRERLALGSLSYPVPLLVRHPAYAVGGLMVILLVVEGATGVFLVQFYHPASSDAYRDVEMIDSKVANGAWMRSLHFWSAYAIAALLGAHFLKNYLIAAYRRPREVQWALGILAGLVLTLSIYTGLILRYDQEGENLLDGTRGLARSLGGLDLLLIEQEARRWPLFSRLFIVHTALLPVALAFLLIIHLYLVKSLGVTRPFWTRNSGLLGTMPFTRHVARLLIYGGFLVGALLAVARLVPAPLVPPSSGSELNTSFPALFVWMRGLAKATGDDMLVMWLVVATLLAILVPLVDRRGGSHPRERVRMLLLLMFFLGLWIVLSLVGSAP